VSTEDLMSALSDVTARLRAAERDRSRRLELFRELHRRGVPWKAIGEVAGISGDGVLRAVKRAEREA
jgi:hypothetical protein